MLIHVIAVFDNIEDAMRIKGVYSKIRIELYDS